MAVGKNKRISKGKKGGKKKAADPFAKDWVPRLLQKDSNTVCLRSLLLIFKEAMKDHAYRKIRLRAEDVQGKNVLTNFWGMNFTTDKLSQIRQIRRKMREIMTAQATSCDLKELVQKFIPEMIGKEIEKATSSIYPLQNVFIRKVKILKAPKFDLGKLMEVHGDYSEDIGVKLERPAEETMAEATPEVVGA
ncbi:hypothetical protein V6N11_054810 [Hibiscus sabdariffa]|uniref:40S ribosomal protein S3a n=1 Tax=Hibiscus sabdariffa TaxID=183260 RepID=A0ABR2S520_9ROSI